MDGVVLLILRVIIVCLGVALVLYTLLSAVRTFVLPRSARDFLTSTVFTTSAGVFGLLTRRAATYEERDQTMALFAPITLLILPAVWLILVMIGYMGMYWAVNAHNPDVSFTRAAIQSAFNVSGSSLLTLGFATQAGFISSALSFSESTLGLILVALLIAYLPTMYSAFARRELAVTMLEIRAGDPPSAIEMFLRFHRLKRMDRLNDLWVQWENWFVDLEESHSSLAALSFFRSPKPHRSWITAAGAVLDSAALARSTLDIPADPQADLMIRAGYLALRHIADFFALTHNPNPAPNDPISVSRVEYDLACRTLSDAGVPLKADREQAWRDFVGWRVNYDTVLLKLCAITMAPYAPWSSDRSLRSMRAQHIFGNPARLFFGRNRETLAERLARRMENDSR